MKKYFAILLFFLAACKYSDKPKHYTGAIINVDYPAYLSKTDRVYPGARFQIHNQYRDVYFVAQDYEPNTDSLYVYRLQDSLVTLAMAQMREPLLESKRNYMLPKGYRACETIFTGTIDAGDESKRLRYIFTTIDAPKHVIHTAGWFFNSKKDLWEKDIKYINNNISIH